MRVIDRPRSAVARYLTDLVLIVLTLATIVAGVCNYLMVTWP
jgi:hypothetical protein